MSSRIGASVDARALLSVPGMRDEIRRVAREEIATARMGPSSRARIDPNAVPWTAVDLPLVDALPRGPQNREEVNFLPTGDPDDGVVWRLLWLRSPGVWAFLGGMWLVDQIGDAETTASSSYTDLATVGPSIIAPAGGLYRVTVGAFIFGISTSINALMSFSVGGASPDDLHAARAITASSTTGGASAVGMDADVSLDTGDTVTAKYRDANSNTARFQNRQVRLIPVYLTPS